ncbi:MAG: PIN domain-containing protein, partial [Tannerella sp.]|nr:PIN domain-containing protein [Tannerella sp.]
MGTKYLLDTNTVLDFMGKLLPEKSQFLFSEIIDEEINISLINKIELLGFAFVEQELIDFVAFATIFPIDDNTTDKTIELRRKYKIKLPDAIIAASAIANNLILIT